MNKEEIESYITELESMFELSELEEHSRNILKVGIYIKQLQQENKQLKQQFDKYKKKITPLKMLQQLEVLEQENQKYKEVIDKANNWVRSYMDEWSINDEVWQELNELLILLEEVE